MVTLTIDGKSVSVPAGTTILEAARTQGIAIPTLCWLQKVSPTGACRICVVEVAGVARPMTACNTPVKDGLVVTTQSDALREIRRQVVELLLINHPLDCPVCDAAGECDLQNLCYEFDVSKQPYTAEDVNHEVINEWPLIQQVPSRCVLCEKCVKVCHETVGSSSLFVNEKGDKAFIDKHLELCEFCGSCVSVCPTGTMISKPFKFRARPWELRKTSSVCALCSSQCQIDVNVKNNRIYRVTSDDATVNEGTLCIGGFFGTGFVHAKNRLTIPLLKDRGILRKSGWSEALKTVAERAAAMKGDAVAGLSSAHLTNEENFLFQKIFRDALGSNNIDSEARFGALRAQKTLNRVLGLQGASASRVAVGQADAVLVFGSDVTAEAPALDWQIEKGCRKRDGKLVIAGLRKVKLNRYANLFLNYRPGTEVTLANALARLILEKGLADEAYLEGKIENFAALKTQLLGCDLTKAAELTGIPLEQIEEGAIYLGKAASVAVIFGGDVTKSDNGEEKIAAIANLAVIAGALQGDAGGIFPVDEKGNIQGLIDMGVCPEFLPGFRPKSGGKDAIAILEGIEKGEIKFLYLAGTNPLVSYPDNGRWRKALEKVDFLVVQDIFSSDLTELADAVFPAVSFTEKTGTVTSFDHRVGSLGRAITPTGDVRPDFEILAELFSILTRKTPTLESVRNEIAAQIPLYSGVFSGSTSAMQKAHTPAEKFRCAPVADGSPAEGLKLLSGKILFQFGTSTTLSAGTCTVAPEGYIAVNPQDAEAKGFKDGDKVRVTSATGTAVAPLKITDTLPEGLLFAPYHFAGTNIQQIIPTGANIASVEITKA